MGEIYVASKSTTAKKTTAGNTQSFESRLWDACEAQRGSVNASRYKHPVLGLVFLKYVNDSFTSYYSELAARLADPDDARGLLFGVNLISPGELEALE